MLVGLIVGGGNSGVTAGLTNTGALVESGVIRPTATTGTLNDYAPTGFAGARYVFQDTSGTTTINGLAGGVDGRVVTFVNIGAASNLSFAHENASSTAANRFQTTGGVATTLSGGSRNTATFIYDGTQSRWVQVALMSTTQAAATAFSSTLTSNGNLAMANVWTQTSGTITPTAITGAVNDYAPTSFSTTITIRQDASAAVDLTGLAGGANGRVIWIHNISSANTITLKHENASSTAANRFLLPNSADVAVRPNGSVMLRYDATSSRWRITGGAP